MERNWRLLEDASNCSYVSSLHRLVMDTVCELSIVLCVVFNFNSIPNMTWSNGDTLFHPTLTTCRSHPVVCHIAT